MKLIITVITAVVCAGLAVPDLALAKSRSSGRGHQSSGSDKAYDDSSNPGRSAGSKSSRSATGKSHPAAKPASRSKAKSRTDSRAKRSAGSKPDRLDAGQARSGFQKTLPCPPTGKSGSACPDEVTGKVTASQGTEQTRNEQINSTKALAKLYMQKAK
jgi:hypothetical protein